MTAIEYQKEMNAIADTYQELSNIVRSIAALEIELKTPNGVVVNRKIKEANLAALKQRFNSIELSNIFANTGIS